MNSAVYNCTHRLPYFLTSTQFDLLVIVILLMLFILYYKGVFGKSAISKVGMLLILVGAVYNLYVRVVEGCVQDNINLGMLYANVFDISITTGVLILVYCVIYKGGEQVV